MTETTTLLAPGTRVRHRRHPDLVGIIKCIEYQDRGVPSAIPYNVEWDNNDRACDVLGWFFLYATEEGIEPETAPQSEERT